MELAMIVFYILVSITVLVVAFKGKKLGGLFTSPYDEDFKEFSEELDQFKEADFGLIRNILNDNAVLSKEPGMVRLEIDNCDECPDNTDSKTCQVRIGSKRFVLLFQEGMIIVFQSKMDQVNPFDILHAFRIMRLTGMGHWFKTINKVCFSRDVQRTS